SASELSSDQAAKRAVKKSIASSSALIASPSDVYRLSFSDGRRLAQRQLEGSVVVDFSARLTVSLETDETSAEELSESVAAEFMTDFTDAIENNIVIDSPDITVDVAESVVLVEEATTVEEVEVIATSPPTASPTASPTAPPTPSPTEAPTAAPSAAPTGAPTGAPTETGATPRPTSSPTPAPSAPPATLSPTPAPVSYEHTVELSARSEVSFTVNTNGVVDFKYCARSRAWLSFGVSETHSM
ncbi:hypothetical protein TeGR_g14373, partial [Tetraparma gracilis]